jgi:predicted LPLAT superfamily acyltransferase/uncharacterized protein (DUF2062 family)
MIGRFVVCIPVYNNPATIVEVIRSCLTHFEGPVMVLDDGSDLPVETLFLQSLPGGHERLIFVRHPKNCGKGVALRTAFREAVVRGFTHLVAIDGDGQHDPAEIPKLVRAAEESPWSLIVGDRDMQTANVPGSSTFGKKFSNFWVRYQTDVGVADSQSGYRIYPLFFVQNMRFLCKRYDFEIEVLTRLIWKGVTVKNVKVSVKYFPKEERVSHFHKWKDNFHISVINTILTVVALLKEQTSPGRSSFAFALGIFIGVTPLYGLHTAIVALVCFVFRFNFIYGWMGTHISLPFFLPFLVLGSKRLGEMALGRDSHNVATFGSSWVVGSLILGLILGTIGFALMYVLKKRGGRQGSPKTWTGKNQNKTGILIVRFVLQKFGLRFAYFFLHFIVFYYFLFSFRTRKSFSEYWKVVHPEFGYWHRQVKIYEQILIFAKTLVDRGLQKSHPEALMFEYELDSSADRFIQELGESKKGIVTVASHLGGWELAMTFFSRVPTDKRMLAVMHGIPGQYGHESSQGPSKHEVIFFNLGENTILKVKDYLGKGQVIGMMGDRPVARSNEMVPFFGKLALFDTTPLRIAIACQSEVYFVFAVKTDLRKYKIFTFKHEVPAGRPRETVVHDLLSDYVNSLERVLREYPEQWFNFFPFWSEAPRGH